MDKDSISLEVAENGSLHVDEGLNSPPEYDEATTSVHKDDTSIETASDTSSRKRLRTNGDCEEDPVMRPDKVLLAGSTPDGGGVRREKTTPPGEGSGMDLRYTVDDVPPWYLCIVLGFQHYLTMFGATASIPLVLAPALCLSQSSLAVSEILSTLFFVSGLVTIIQSTVGIRLPVIQGGTFSFLVPAFAILSLPEWQCPAKTDPNNSTLLNTTWNVTSNVTEAPPISEEDIWQPRMRELQGAIMTASLVQVIIGATGLMGYIMRYIGPLTICPTIALIGIALFDVAANTCATQWGIAVLTMSLIILFSQYLRNLDIPVFVPTRTGLSKGKKYGCTRSSYPIFKMFPVILAILLVWLLCFILTVSGAFPPDNGARTDANNEVLHQARWFRFPYPFQWGIPTFNVAGMLGMIAGVIAGMLESVGDYYACARMAAAPPPPIHAVNRGILIEGIGCILSGMWGTGTGTTSYSENIGAIGITKVGSRRVIQTSGCIMMILGMFGKFGALFVTIPSPIVGGIFMTMFGMITAVGVSNLQYCNLNSSRNLFIFGFAIMFGLSIPKWLGANPGVINTGEPVLDQILSVLLGTSMFLGGSVAFLLDNTVPGTLEERGITRWREQLVDKEDEGGEAKPSNCYDIPVISKCYRKYTWTRYIPFCPTYTGYKCKCCYRCQKHRKPSETDVIPCDEENLVNKQTHTTVC